MDCRGKLSRLPRALLAACLASFLILLAPFHALAEPSNTTSPSSGSHTWALLVGVSQYKSPMIASLNSPAADVTAVAAALEDPKLGGVPPSHVLLLTNQNATCANIKNAVDVFFKPNVRAGDDVILYLAGHGVAKGIGADAKGYLLPYDVRGLSTQALDESAVNLKDFSDRLAHLPASQFVAFVDACREDPTPGRGVKGNVLTDIVSSQMQIQPEDNGTARRASVTFFACSVGQRAYEDPTYHHGVFTYWILDGIRQGAVPELPDGAVDMGRLGTYVTGKVTDWAKSESASGDFDIDQTPQLVTTALPRPVVLMRVKRTFPADALAPAPPNLLVSTYPDDATVMVNGKEVGAGDVNAALANGGQATVTVTAAGYAPVHKTVNAYPGYGEEVVVNLPPASRGLTAANDPEAATPIAAPGSYTRALDADEHRRWTEAERGYKATIAAGPDFAPAYERLAEIERNEGRIGESVATLIAMNTVAPSTANSLSELSLAYSQFAFQGRGASSGAGRPLPTSGRYHYPASAQDAGKQALMAADAAVAINAKLAEAQRALGFALVAVDKDGANKTAAQNAFAEALFLDSADPANHYGVAFGIRSYAQLIQDDTARNAEIRRAVDELQQAVQIRPGYYEAHRELGYCYHLLGDRDDAEREYTNAAANRGQATDGNEVAGVNCALAVLAKQDAMAAPANEKREYDEASQGYWSDAKDITPNLTQAVTTLRNVGLGPMIMAYLPENLRDRVDWHDTLVNRAPNAPAPNITVRMNPPAIVVDNSRPQSPPDVIFINHPGIGAYSASTHGGVTLSAAGIALLICLILVLLALAALLTVKAVAVLNTVRKPGRAPRDNQIDTLRRNRSLLLTTMNSIGDALVATDAGGRITFMNLIAEKMTGWGEAEAVGKAIVQVVTMESDKAGSKIDLPVAQVLQNSVNKELSSNVFVLSRGGGKKPVAGQAVPVWDDAGTVSGAALIFRDVSERKSAREAVRASQAHKEAIIENAIECVILMDHEGRVIEFNAAAESTFGYGRGEALGRPVADLIVPPALRERHVRGFRRFLDTLPTPGPSLKGRETLVASGTSKRDVSGDERSEDKRTAALSHSGAEIGKRVEMTGMRKDGVEIPIELAVTVVPNQDPPVFAAFLRDVSDRKAGEAALIAAKEAAETESRDKSRFLNNMSDELRTPLNAVIGYSEMLQEEIRERRPEELIPDLKKISDAARHLMMLVNDVLDLARIEAGQMELYPETFDVADMIRDIEQAAQPLVAKNDNQFKITPGINLGSMHSDRLKIRQCILYLLNNACRFANQRDLDLRVARIGANIQFRMLDLSPSVAVEATDQLVDALAAGGPKSTPRFGGHGLGLVIARHFCKMMSGELVGERKVGHSPTYTITLPDKI
jgi:PAS domain S-box-containing protein